MKIEMELRAFSPEKHTDKVATKELDKSDLVDITATAKAAPEWLTRITNVALYITSLAGLAALSWFILGLG